VLNAAFAELGLDWVYVALEVGEGRGGPAVEAVRTLALEGLSVTMPHKAAAAAAVDQLSPEARALGAVNVVSRRGEVLHGHNTDGPGLLDALAEDAGFAPEGCRALVVGAGGAARAVVLALATAGAREVVVANRTPDRAAAAAALAPAVARVGSAEEAGAVELVVNATPVGSALGGGGSEPGFVVDPGRLGPGQVVAELAYHPPVTRLMVEARARGATAVGGVGMLVHQAARALALWTGEEPPVAAMRAAAEAALAARDR